MTVDEELARARQQLLDLSMRNRLLNFRPTMARTVRVVDEIPAEIYDILVVREKSMEFLPNPEPTQSEFVYGRAPKIGLNDLGGTHEGLTKEEASILWKMPRSGTQVAGRHIDRFLQTSLDSESLQRRLFYIYQDAISIVEEVGYSTLFLAMSFLQWTESHTSDQVRQAPLILVPVELERSRVGASFRVRWNGDDIPTNISLQAFLAEQGVALPDFEMPDAKLGVDNYLQKVTQAVSGKQKWHVVNDIYLGFFSFTKFVMYKDLDPDAWPEDKSPADHHLIRDILMPSGSLGADAGYSENNIDEKLTFRDLYQVMDADPSQMVAIEDAKAGRNLVVEGPPGTGKSQTITNLIGELLAAGKTVLFVSEKMAALEVVKDRLDEVGLGPFCLELHSRKSTRRAFMKELEHAISISQPRRFEVDDDFTQWEVLRSQLNGYAEQLRQPFGILELSPFDLFGLSEKSRHHFGHVGRDMPRIRFANIDKWSRSQFEEAKSKLRDLQDILALVKPVAGHPWRGCHPRMILPSDQDAIADTIGKCSARLDELMKLVDKLASLSGVVKPIALKGLPSAINAAKVVASSQPADRRVLENAEWNQPSCEASELIGKLESYNEMLSIASVTFKEEGFEQDVASLLDEYGRLSSKFLSCLNRRYRTLKRHIESLYMDARPRPSGRIMADLAQLKACVDLRDSLRQANEKGRALFGSHWRADDSDPEKLRLFSEWIIAFRKHLLTETLSHDAIELVSEGVSAVDVELVLSELEETSRVFSVARDFLVASTELDCRETFGASADDVEFSVWRSHLQLWRDSIGELQRWFKYEMIRTECLKTVAAPIIGVVEEGALEPEDLLPCLEGNASDGLLDLVFAKRPALAKFDADLHEVKIKRFAETDRTLISKNRQRLSQLIHQARPRLAGGASSASEAGILLGEMNKKRRHMPIRRLMSLAGGLIQKIKPCFMMSPLSIAQFLDPRTARFDVIIFDEASQVRPEDALGALLRGDQVVVMGDTRQLPPTAFFEHMGQSDDEDTIEDLTP